MSTDPAGFVILIVAVAESEESVVLVACTVTALGEGGVTGGVYRPPASMVPTVAFPPATPLTDHVTEEPAPPLAVTVNWRVSPTKTVAVLGLTWSEAETVGVLAVPPQPASCRHSAPIANASISCRTLFAIGDPLLDFCLSNGFPPLAPGCMGASKVTFIECG